MGALFFQFFIPTTMFSRSLVRSARRTSLRSFPRFHRECTRRTFCAEKPNAHEDVLSSSPTAQRITRGVGVALLGCVGWYIYDLYRQNNPQEVADVKVKTEGEINIGAPFVLLDHNGDVKDSAKDFAGKFMLIYFGFTFCPDICPTELTKMADVVNQLEELGKADEVVPILITVDPYRDTVEQINSYVQEFHPRIVGLTGTPAEIKQVAKDYRIYNVVPEEAGQEDYLVDHSVFTFLMGPKGGFLDFFGPDKDDQEILDRILERMQDHEDEINPPSLWIRLQRRWDSTKDTLQRMIGSS